MKNLLLALLLNTYVVQGPREALGGPPRSQVFLGAFLYEIDLALLSCLWTTCLRVWVPDGLNKEEDHQ